MDNGFNVRSVQTYEKLDVSNILTTDQDVVYIGTFSSSKLEPFFIDNIPINICNIDEHALKNIPMESLEDLGITNKTLVRNFSGSDNIQSLKFLGQKIVDHCLPSTLYNYEAIPHKMIIFNDNSFNYNVNVIDQQSFTHYLVISCYSDCNGGQLITRFGKKLPNPQMGTINYTMIDIGTELNVTPVNDGSRILFTFNVKKFKCELLTREIVIPNDLEPIKKILNFSKCPNNVLIAINNIDEYRHYESCNIDGLLVFGKTATPSIVFDRKVKCVNTLTQRDLIDFQDNVMDRFIDKNSNWYNVSIQLNLKMAIHGEFSCDDFVYNKCSVFMFVLLRPVANIYPYKQPFNNFAIEQQNSGVQPSLSYEVKLKFYNGDLFEEIQLNNHLVEPEIEKIENIDVANTQNLIIYNQPQDSLATNHVYEEPKEYPTNYHTYEDIDNSKQQYNIVPNASYNLQKIEYVKPFIQNNNTLLTGNENIFTNNFPALPQTFQNNVYQEQPKPQKSKNKGNNTIICNNDKRKQKVYDNCYTQNSKTKQQQHYLKMEAFNNFKNMNLSKQLKNVTKKTSTPPPLPPPNTYCEQTQKNYSANSEYNSVGVPYVPMICKNKQPCPINLSTSNPNNIYNNLPQQLAQNDNSLLQYLPQQPQQQYPHIFYNQPQMYGQHFHNNMMVSPQQRPPIIKTNEMMNRPRYFLNNHHNFEGVPLMYRDNQQHLPPKNHYNINNNINQKQPQMGVNATTIMNTKMNKNETSKHWNWLMSRNKSINKH